jgi:orotidine 5'-phosphate decarboxylase subfamily 2
MLFEDKVKTAYKEAKSVLCVGLDPLPEVIPPKYDLSEWAKGMVESTYDIALAFKANLSGYVGGGKDLDALKETCRVVKERGRLFIVDSKANDVGFTAAEYARRYLKEIDADACTVNALPWLNDVIDPFTPYLDEKGIFILVYTTSPNSEMFWKNFKINNYPAWKFIALKIANEWTQKLPKQDYSPIGIVAGPRDERLAREIRSVCDTQIVLVPGLGAQGVPVKILKYLKKEAGFPGIIGNVGRDIAAEWKKYPEEDPFKATRRKAEEWHKILGEV